MSAVDHVVECAFDATFSPVIRAALFDFGGVILSSPFEAFARYERERGLADGFLRRLNSTRPDENAWAQLERGHVSFDAFCRLYEGEARAAGGEVDAREVMALLAGDVRPAMVEAVDSLSSDVHLLQRTSVTAGPATSVRDARSASFGHGG